jgi:hypothetical protein
MQKDYTKSFEIKIKINKLWQQLLKTCCWVGDEPYCLDEILFLVQISKPTCKQ